MDVAVHIGSIFAVMIFFSEDVLKIITGVLKTKLIPSFKNYGSRLFWLMVIATIPAVIAGLVFKNYGTEWVRDTRIIGWNILIFGIILFIADKIGMTIRKVEHLGIIDAILIGCAQCLALIPGTSRSGITITMSRFLGLERRDAARFSMLISIPTIIGAGLLFGYELYQDNNLQAIMYSLDAIAYSFIASIISIYIIMWWLKSSTFLPFVIYRIVLGTFLLLDSYNLLNFN